MTSRQQGARASEVPAGAEAEAELPRPTRLLLRGVRAAARIPGLTVAARAVRGYILHQSGTQAGSVAFSALLSMFPLLILLSTAAAFIGHPGDAAALVGRVLGYAPPVVQAALRPVVEQVIGQRNQALLALGMLVTVWTASSGMQSIRTALNRAYGVDRGLSFWQARIKVTLCTVIVGGATLVTFSSVIVMPYVWQFVHEAAGAQVNETWLLNSVRYGAAFVVVSTLYALLYAWLPDLRLPLRAVLPGALLGALLWVGAAALLSVTLRSAAKLLLVYGGFAGTVATLVFLYVSAATLIFGAELNAVLHHRPRNRG
jgi:membrane protein